ncbi:MAG: methyltransferase domain-containing protein [Halioglobus sp.]
MAGVNFKPGSGKIHCREAVSAVQATSRPVRSKQQHLHPNLAKVVRRHLQTVHRNPVSAHSLQAYAVLTAALAGNPRPLVLDSFCGTGRSTAMLAERHPGHLVVGVDKSAARLAKHQSAGAENYLLLQADCGDIWTLMQGDGLVAAYHYMLYPNPWPKSAHLQRRVHGHPSYASLLPLGGRHQLRSNWQLYVEEFGCAMHLAGQRGWISKLGNAGPDLSLFEQKYRLSGHVLWSFKARIMP